MKNNFIPHHTNDAIVNHVMMDEARRVRLRMEQLRAGKNPHEEVVPGYISTSYGRMPQAEELNDPYFNKKNKLRGKLKNIKYVTHAEMRKYAFEHRNSPMSPLDED